jgi:hypothetical protein
MSERYEVPPERLGRWLERWAAEHGPVTRTDITAERVVFHGGTTLVCEPPFPPLGTAVPRPSGSSAVLPPGRGTFEGFEPGPLLTHVARERVVGVLLVRLGGYAAGVFSGRRLIVSKVGSRLVHARHKKGGSSQQRFARRRAGQARAALEAAADVAAGILLPHRADLEALVLGGDRRALATVMEDPRLRALAPLGQERVLDVPDPRLDVLRATPERFLATVLRPSG